MSYTTPPDPIGANPSFTVAPSFVSQAPQLNGADVNVAHNLTVNGHYNGLPRLKTVVGYTSNKFSTAAVGTPGRSHLMIAPGLDEPTSELLAVSQGAIFIPAGAVLEAVQTVASTTVVGGTDFDIGVGAFGASSTNLFNAVNLASVNSGAMALGCNGATCLSGAGTAATAGGGYGVVDVNTTPNTAGALKVVINYWEVPSQLEQLGNPPAN